MVVYLKTPFWVKLRRTARGPCVVHRSVTLDLCVGLAAGCKHKQLAVFGAPWRGTLCRVPELTLCSTK
jgi:hypothetical protein